MPPARDIPRDAEAAPAGRASTDRRRALAWAIPALALLAAGLVVASVARRPDQAATELLVGDLVDRAPAALPDLGPIPAVDVTDQTGARGSTADLAGRVTIVNFIFTRCPTICPVTSMKMARLAERTVDARAVGLLSISVDPAHDSPPVLAEFAARYRADPARWRFVTGEPAALARAVEDGFKLALERRGELEGGVPDIVHGGHFVLVDQGRRIRGYYDSDDAARLDALVADARALAGAAR